MGEMSIKGFLSRCFSFQGSKKGNESKSEAGLVPFFFLCLFTEVDIYMDG